MGRVSKRKSARQALAEGGSRKYLVGIYARISSFQRKKQKESVETQIEIAENFVNAQNQKEIDEVMCVVRCYCDIGKTGSDFERAEFLQMLHDIKSGKINCVIVKDLSRLGRNYLEVGTYIEHIFPLFGVRFIAVMDGYDTKEAGNEARQMAFEIKNLINDMYAKEFSMKAKLHLQQRRMAGSYVGGPAPYGYRTGWEKKRRMLIPDDKTAGIVQFMYQMFSETNSYAAVVKALNQRKINPPAVYQKTGETVSSNDAAYKGWNHSTVKRILHSDLYFGTLVQGKTSITARNEKNRKRKPKEEWVITEHAHLPLIDDNGNIHHNHNVS